MASLEVKTNLYSFTMSFVTLKILSPISFNLLDNLLVNKKCHLPKSIFTGIFLKGLCGEPLIEQL